MGEIEVSNEQFRTIFPEHDSRFIRQLWKDHVHQGYPANNPEQPAIRVSWEEAMAFCKKLSEKTVRLLLFLPRFSGSGPAVQVATVSSGMVL